MIAAKYKPNKYSKWLNFNIIIDTNGKNMKLAINNIAKHINKPVYAIKFTNNMVWRKDTGWNYEPNRKD